MFPMIDLFAPLRATANRCGLGWANPFVLYAADKLSTEALEHAAGRYVGVLKDWIATTPVPASEKAVEPTKAQLDQLGFLHFGKVISRPDYSSSSSSGVELLSEESLAKTLSASSSSSAGCSSR